MGMLCVLLLKARGITSLEAVATLCCFVASISPGPNSTDEYLFSTMANRKMGLKNVQLRPIGQKVLQKLKDP